MLYSPAGKVYNMTPYMKFHPGGVDELMRGAGKDCTILFDEVRRPLRTLSLGPSLHMQLQPVYIDPKCTFRVCMANVNICGCFQLNTLALRE